MENPLALLVKQLGLDVESLAKRAKLPAKTVESALAEPDKQLAAFLQIASTIGVRFKLEAAQSFAFWMSGRAIDRLLTENNWRANVGLCKFPRNTAQLMQIITVLRGRGLSHSEIAAYLNIHFIPNARSSSPWNGHSVCVRIGSGGVEDRRCKYAESRGWRQLWRKQVVSLLMSHIFPADPAVALRYGLEVEYGDKVVIVRATRPIPKAIETWIVETMHEIRWFGTGYCGIGEPDMEMFKPRTRARTVTQSMS